MAGVLEAGAFLSGAAAIPDTGRRSCPLLVEGEVTEEEEEDEEEEGIWRRRTVLDWERAEPLEVEPSDTGEETTPRLPEPGLFWLEPRRTKD